MPLDAPWRPRKASVPDANVRISFAPHPSVLRNAPSKSRKDNVLNANAKKLRYLVHRSSVRPIVTKYRVLSAALCVCAAPSALHLNARRVAAFTGTSEKENAPDASAIPTKKKQVPCSVPL